MTKNMVAVALGIPITQTADTKDFREPQVSDRVSIYNGFLSQAKNVPLDLSEGGAHRVYTTSQQKKKQAQATYTESACTHQRMTTKTS